MPGGRSHSRLDVRIDRCDRFGGSENDIEIQRRPHERMERFMAAARHVDLPPLDSLPFLDRVFRTLAGDLQQGNAPRLPCRPDVLSTQSVRLTDGDARRKVRTYCCPVSRFLLPDQHHWDTVNNGI